MSHIEISTDGTRYNQLVRLHEEQIENLKQSEEREIQAYEAYDTALWDTLTNTSADADYLVELINKENATLEYRAAVENGLDVSKRAVATAVELVAELLHDNIDTLDGKSLNDKAVSIALNGVLTDDIRVFTNNKTKDTILYVVEGGGSSFRMRRYLWSYNKATHIRPCRTDSDIISKQRYMSDYYKGIYAR